MSQQVPESRIKNIRTVLVEYGNAMVDDDAVSGTHIAIDMDTINKWLRAGIGTVKLPEMRAELRLCPHGNGHWSDNCEETK